LISLWEDNESREREVGCMCERKRKRKRKRESKKQVNQSSGLGERRVCIKFLNVPAKH
jgi:hypothetical protein